MARPTIYNKKVLTKTKEYIDSCTDSYVVLDKPRIENDKVKESKTVKRKVKIPTIEGLAVYIHVHKDIIQEWKKKYPEFSVLISELLAKQADALINHGLSGDYNFVIAKVLLTKHGYREGVDTTTNDKDLPSPILGGITKKENEI